MTPDQLDPLEAAAAPISVDPAVAARLRKWGQPEIDAHVAETIAASNDADEAHKVLMAQLIEGGMTPEQASEVSGRDWARATVDARLGGIRNARMAAEAPPVVAEVPADMQPRTPDELRGLGLNPMTEPGPSMPDGRPMKQPRAIANERAARAYNERPEMVPATDPTELGGTARYAPSLRDLAMEARGFKPVYNHDGGVSYQPSPDTGVRGMPGGLGRGGVRLDMEAPMRDELGNELAAPKFVRDEALGPTGTQVVYRQSDAARQRQNAYESERRLYRMASAAGVSPQEMLKQNPEAFGDLTAGGTRQQLGVRMMVEGKLAADEQKRMDQWKSQMMLAGRDPRKNLVNAFNMSGDPSLTPEQQRSLRYMLPGGDRAAAVDAAHNQQLTNLGLKVAQGVATGQGFSSQMPPELAAAAGMKATADARRADPQAAGMADLAAGKPTPEAEAELERLATLHDSGDAGVWWLGGMDDMSDRDESRLAETLQGAPYNMPPATAAKVAREAAERRRFSYRKRGPVPAQAK